VKNKRISFRERFNRIFFFFPFQLLLLHVKKNHLVLFTWAVLFGIVSGISFKKYGVPYLLWYPEYLGASGPSSFAILGFAFGGFIMAFNLYSYIMHGFRFTFITSVSRPFLKFSLNNVIVPLIFILYYFFHSYHYQVHSELLEPLDAWLNLGSFIGGAVTFIAFAFFYFFKTNLDIFKFFKRNTNVEELAKQTQKRRDNLMHNRRLWRVETYMVHPFKIALARKNYHYSEDVSLRILQQNHINASVFEMLTILSFITLGTLTEFEVFVLPAGANILLLATMFLMMLSALFSWFKGWTFTIILASLVVFNLFVYQKNFLSAETRAYGLDYSTKVDLEAYHENRLPKPSQIAEDRENTLHILQKRVQAITEKTGKKPKLFFINSSGGGIRSALWTFRCLSYLDSVSNGDFFKHTQLITGASGGMLGVNLYKELLLDSVPFSSSINYQGLGKDLLNPLSVSLVTNDLFVRYKKFEDNGFRYTKDRGFYWEKYLRLNTNNHFNLRLGDFAAPEANAHLPMTILSPVLVNDGRKLLISATGVTYMSIKVKGKGYPIFENYDFKDVFKHNQPDSLRISSALRMNATFPYILPNTVLPTENATFAMDAGLRDNYGFTLTTDYIWAFRDWLKRNTDGVVIVQLRDLEKRATQLKDLDKSFLAKMSSPINSLYGNLFNVHNYSEDQLFKILSEAVDFPLDFYQLELFQSEENKVSLSFHLSSVEKKFIYEGISDPRNQTRIDSILSKL
tara:strand:+ start:127357 stop:129573 length:2217 start_codon:yes stop_codon:yes gene_type:complete